MSTYTPIASITLASAASSVTFSGIPQTYTDLVIVASGTVNTNSYFAFRFNGDTGNNYSNTEMDGNGTAASSNRNTNNNYLYNGSIYTTQTNVINHIQNYANSTTNKTVLTRSNNAGAIVKASVGLWRNTSAITSIEMSTAGANTFASGSTFNLYGIANASITNVAKATGGDSVYTDGTYWYHIFRSSGTFTPTQALTADYLVVAGGGGGAGNFGGGGGAGGLRCTVGATGGSGSLESALSLTASTNYTVTVGAGGTGGAAAGSGSSLGGNGSNSVFSTITSTGGGGGGAVNGTNASDRFGASGGSGGGSGAVDGTSGTTTGGAASPANQGFAGGDGYTNLSTIYNAGGGGGAGGAGQNGSTTTANVPGNGGAGRSINITGSSVGYGGGGAAGGGGSTTGTATDGGGANAAGTANTGGGGGGSVTSNSPRTGKAGGSGIVVIRYSAA